MENERFSARWRKEAGDAGRRQGGCLWRRGGSLPPGVGEDAPRRSAAELSPTQQAKKQSSRRPSISARSRRVAMLARGFSFMLFPLQLMARVHTSRRDAPGRVSCSASQQGRGLTEWGRRAAGHGAEPRKGHIASSRCHKASVTSYPAQSLSNN